MYYIDTSAALKLVVAEAGSSGLQAWIQPAARKVFSSDLLRTELVRAVRRSAPGREARAREVLGLFLLLELTTSDFERAATIEPRGLRSLDAMHLVAATVVGDALEGIITYDERLAEAARAIGIPVIAPH